MKKKHIIARKWVYALHCKEEEFRGLYEGRAEKRGGRGVEAELLGTE
jgi:hypothetical protein